ncbi:MAG: hypothetical protein QF415_04520 [Candidatus Undinarchaeales archaeon]|jgi:hypothetical protein|nr:hypothetical protein [Candidatus Undinarchaeales archaeon]MDP7492512.1 hypothetical protein [Candidatus Undinarchaeales archaeon]
MEEGGSSEEGMSTSRPRRSKLLLLVCSVSIILLLVWAWAWWTVHSRPVTIFFRDDDVGSLTPALVNFTQMFIDEGVPVALGIMPKALTPECTVWLKEMKRRHPDLIELDQHGFTHQVKVVGDRSEFRGRRRQVDIINEIISGYGILLQEFGDDFSLIITVPFSAFDIKAVGEVWKTDLIGYSTHYAGIERQLWSNTYAQGLVWNPRVKDYSTCVDIMTWDPLAFKARDEIAAEIDDCASTAGAVGIMLHHEWHHTPENLNLLRDVIRMAKERPGARIVLMQNLYKELDEV